MLAVALAGPRFAQDPLPSAAPAARESDDAELEQLLSEERAEADRLRRRGDRAGARQILSQHVADDPEDAASRALLARCWLDEGDLERAEAEVARAVAPPASGSAAAASAARERALVLVDLRLEQGRAADALAALEAAHAALSLEDDPRDAMAQARALTAAGRRDEARSAFERAAHAPLPLDAGQLLEQARALRALGRLESAAATLVAADRQAAASGGSDPDVLVELGQLYFEADGEVDHREVASRSPAALFREALRLAPGHAGALLGLWRLHRFNWHRQSRTAESFLDELFAAAPHSIAGELAAAAADVDDGDLMRARERLGRLERAAPARREVRTLAASVAAAEGSATVAEAELAALAAADPADSAPEREVGTHLVELYRFVEALPYLRRAVQRDERDWQAWTQLGRALANSGAEQEGRQALVRAEREAAGRANAWRHNTLAVLERLETRYVTARAGELSFAWMPDEAALLELYLVPHYRAAREELARRYGYTPGPTHIETFREHADFSVRSTGFEGFPALGVCFGPVVTAVSPLCGLRGTFSWARTSFHEFTHVVHLALTHNRCPRWITEGLATWEEEQKNPAWTRNMRRELLDARAAGAIIPVRELNRAFRSERILFGYYQGGLLCRMLIDQHGFPSMVRLLEAFDRSADLDQAMSSVLGVAPEELDRRFAGYVDGLVADLALEPRWPSVRVASLALALPRTPPQPEEERARWAGDWLTVAWGHWQQQKRVDAEEAVRRAELAGPLPPRGLFLRAELALARQDARAARDLWERAFAAGGDDYRARIALGRILLEDDPAEAELQLLAAEKAFPGFDDPHLSAELTLAALYEEQGRRDEAMQARERWLSWNSGVPGVRMDVARWHAEARRFAEAERYFREANEVDPFRRALHVAWADCLEQLERWPEAAREWLAARLVPSELDADKASALTDAERAELLAKEARARARAGENEAARALAGEALALDPQQPIAREVRDALP